MHGRGSRQGEGSTRIVPGLAEGFIEKNIDVRPFIDELKSNEHLWQMVSNIATNIGGQKNPYGFLPLTMGVQINNENIKHSDKQQNTPAYEQFPVLRNWLKEHGCDKHSRAAFFKLKPEGIVGLHIDDGLYYKSRDRYHFSLQGEYEYWVGEEFYIIKPGTFFWFNNQIEHAARNILDVDRITFVFDVPKSPNNH